MKKSKLIIVAPHPDDEWIGCGCSIQKAVDEGRKVKVILVTGRVKSRVELSKELAKKYGYELLFLDETERNLNEENIINIIKKEISINDTVLIPSYDSHPDHQLINIIAKENIKNKELFEYGIYNNSKNIFKRAFNKIKSLITKKGYTSFFKGRGVSFSYKEKVKQKHIKEFDEFPRAADLLRPAKTKLNIVFLTKDYHVNTVDAGFTSILNLAKKLKEKGHFVTMISNKSHKVNYGSPANKIYEVFKGIPIYRPYGFKYLNFKIGPLSLNFIINRFIAPVLGLRYVQKKLKFKFNIIHGSSSASYLIIPSLLAKLFSQRAKIFHSIRSESHFSLWGLKTSFLLNFTQKTFVTLQSLIKKIIKDGCNPKNLELIRSSIDLSKFKRIKEKPESLRKKHNVAKEDKVVLYYGKGGHLKGVDVLLKAINFIPENEKVKFIFYHPVIWLPHIVKLYEKHKYKYKISFNIGKINVPDYLNMADIQVLPFKSIQGTEGNPLCLLEGMSTKTPIVTTELNDLKEIVEKDKDVLMAQPDNPESLANEIMRLLNDKELQKILICNSYEKSKSFDINIITKQIHRNYLISLNK